MPISSIAMRVLIVEDSHELAASIHRSLEEAGVKAEIANDGAEGLAAASHSHFDVVVLDVMLGSGPTGLSVCAELRNRSVDCRILMLTALDTVADRVAGLEVGADDYLVKPFAQQELLARIRALARRHRVARDAVTEVGGVRLDTAARTVSVDGMRIDLSKKEFDILDLLMTGAGQTISKEQIHDYAWSHDVTPESNLVEVYVGRIRRRLEATRPGTYITTVRQLGYRFERGDG